MKKAAKIILICVLMSVVFSSFAWAENDIDVSFEQEYAVSGQALSVVVGSDENCTYEWYADGERLECTDSTYYPVDDDLEKMLRVEITTDSGDTGSTEMFFSRLPVVYINTENQQPVVSKDDYINAQITVQGNAEYNSKTTTLYSGKTEIKGRGNSTWMRFDKKPYKLKLDKKTALFGMNKSKHWVLLANYIDASCVRNMTSTALARIYGASAVDSIFAEVVFNGVSVGLYQLCEHVRVSEGLVDVFDWEDAAGEAAKAIAKKEKLSDEDKDALSDMMETELSWITSGIVTYNDVTYTVSDYYKDIPDSFDGGFLIELDSNFDELSRFYTNNNVPIMFKSPEYLFTNNSMFTSAKGYIQSLENALYSADKCTVRLGKKVSYADLCDIDSMVSYWLTSELMKNEAGGRSTYMQKEIGGKLIFGPVWDFDWSAGAAAPFGYLDYTGWKNAYTAWFSNALSDPYFLFSAVELFRSKYNEVCSLICKNGTIDGWYAQINDAAVHNQSLWDYGFGFEEDYALMKKWMNNRLKWMSEQLYDYETALNTFGISTSDNIKLSLAGDTALNAGDVTWYAENGDMLSLLITCDGSAKNASYYVNGKYCGTLRLNNGNVRLSLKNSLLKNDGVNTVVVRSNGEMQCLALTLTEKNEYATVRFLNGGDVVREETVPVNTSLVAPCVQPDSDNALYGWDNAGHTTAAGKTVIITESTDYFAVYSECTGYAKHRWCYDSNGKYCSECHIRCEDDRGLVKLSDCEFYGGAQKKYHQVYTGSGITYPFKLTYNGVTLKNKMDYVCEYIDNINVGYATVKATGVVESGYCGVVYFTYRINQADIANASVSGLKAEYAFTDSDLTPVIKLTYKKKTLTEGKDYTVSYTDNKAVGTATVTIKGTGNFTGSKSIGFNITPQKAGVPTVTKKTKSTVTLKWDAVKGASKYKLFISTDAKSWKAVVTTEKRTYTVKNLKSATVYYFRLCATSNGITGEYGNKLKIN